MQKPEITAFHDAASGTMSYVVRDPAGGSAAIIDPVLEIDYAAGRLAFTQAERIADFITDHAMTVEWIIETHVHADHISAAPWLQDRLGGRIGIGERICVVQETFGKVFNEGTEFRRDGSQFDVLFHDGDAYMLGALSCRAIATPGHTPACMTHLIGDAAFVGDTLFMPDAGSARADFPGGDAGQLYDSIQKILALPDDTRLFMCHDYGPGGRDVAWETTVAQQRSLNIHVGQGRPRDEFIALRTNRDAFLPMPRLILPSLQVNMKGGHLPEPDARGVRMLKVPLGGLDAGGP